MIRTALILALSGCWGHSFPGWDATPQAGFERMAGAHLTICVRNNWCQQREACFSESAAHCTDAGYPASCGQREPEGSCADGLRR